MEKVGWFFFPCSEGIVANLGYLQSRRKTGIIHGTYVKTYFIQPKICMRFFCRFFYPGDDGLGQTVPKRSRIFQRKTLKKFPYFCISVMTSNQDQWFNLLFVVGWVRGLHWQITRYNPSNWNKSNTQTLTAVAMTTAARRECCGNSPSCQEQNDTPPFLPRFCVSVLSVLWKDHVMTLLQVSVSSAASLDFFLTSVQISQGKKAAQLCVFAWSIVKCLCIVESIRCFQLAENILKLHQ